MVAVVVTFFLFLFSIIYCQHIYIEFCDSTCFLHASISHNRARQLAFIHRTYILYSHSTTWHFFLCYFICMHMYVCMFVCYFHLYFVCVLNSIYGIFGNSIFIHFSVLSHFIYGSFILLSIIFLRFFFTLKEKPFFFLRLFFQCHL